MYYTSQVIDSPVCTLVYFLQTENAERVKGMDLTVSSMEDLQQMRSLVQEYIMWLDRSEKTARTYICNLRQWAAWLQYRQIRRPERTDVIAYREWLLAPHEAIELTQEAPGWRYRLDENRKRIVLVCQPTTAAMYVRSVRQFYAWTASAGLYENIGQDVRVPAVTRKSSARDRLQRQEVLQVEQSIQKRATEKAQSAAASGRTVREAEGRLERATVQGKRLYAMYMLAVCCGLRTIELHRANVKDLYLHNGNAWIMVYGKGHTAADQAQALPAAVYEALEDYLSARTDQFDGNSPLFVATGNRSGGQRIAVTTISTMLKRALQEAGLDSERLTAHSLRHTATSAAFNATGNLYIAQKYARHSSPTTTEIYIHEDGEERRSAEAAETVYQYYHRGADWAEEKKGLEEQQLQKLEKLSQKQLDMLIELSKTLTQDD